MPWGALIERHIRFPAWPNRDGPHNWHEPRHRLAIDTQIGAA